MRKKRVLFHSDFALVKTGFGRAMKTLLSHLYKTKKYEIHHVCCGIVQGAQELKATPWASYGAISSDQNRQNQALNDPALSRIVGYGGQTIDSYVKAIKPDIYIGVQDFWGVDFSIDKNWFRSITSCIWTTLDSLPILPSAVKRAGDIKNYWVWSNFAEKALHTLGNKHVKTMHGPIESDCFYRLKDEERLFLRKENNIPEDSIVIGFVFRNQLRKSVPNLMEGYKIWKDRHPEIKNTKLLLHTSFSEGWNIKAQAEQHGVNTKEILTTYICQKCNKYEVKSFDDRENLFEKDDIGNFKFNKHGKKIEIALVTENKDCRFCSSKNTQKTTSVGLGITEQQLNQVYNLMDVYVHPFTSGGQEIPIQEAKLTELITLVTNYSCGEECCEEQAFSLPLKWDKYLEHGTEFIKATTKPSSIADQLDLFINLSTAERKERGEKARRWSIDNFCIKNIGKKIEDFLDSSPLINEKNENLFSHEADKQINQDAEVNPSLPNKEWVKSLYSNILGREIEDDDEGFLYWMQQLSKNIEREKIEQYFRHVAKNDLDAKKNTSNQNPIEKFIVKNRKKKILYAAPRSAAHCFLATSIISALRKLYDKESWDLYVSSDINTKPIFDGNENITAWIPYTKEMENTPLMEGTGDHHGYFDICFNSNNSIQQVTNYTHNAMSKLLL
jgi:glycosyltransferase involved in cell wall biosynthesis